MLASRLEYPPPMLTQGTTLCCLQYSNTNSSLRRHPCILRDRRPSLSPSITSTIALTDGEVAEKVQQLISLRPYDIEQRFKLRDPIYLETAAYGHMGRSPEVVTKRFVDGSGRVLEKKVTLFPWEKLDYVDTFKKAFAL